MIDAKNTAIQSALKAENEVKEAEANAKIAVAKAEGNAKAMKIKADAEAYYNRTIAASLSPMIVQEDMIEKWDGKMPQIMTGNGGMMMDISKIVGKWYNIHCDISLQTTTHNSRGRQEHQSAPPTRELWVVYVIILLSDDYINTRKG